MPENTHTRTRTNTRRASTPDPDTSIAEDVTDTLTAEQASATVPATVPEDVSQTVPDSALGWAEVVPWLALRWGSAPTATEVRFAPVVWAMLHDHAGPHERPGPGRTVLQMAAEAELAGHTDLDPTVLTRVLVRYERAGVVRSVTDGRLARWTVLDLADIIAQAQESARTGDSGARNGRAATPGPAGELRGLVAEHLAAHPGEDFSPTQVANALTRSSGAVANALARLVEHGAAVQTSTSPRRYQHHTDPTQDSTDLDRKAS